MNTKENHSTSKTVGKIKYTGIYDGVRRFDARIETIHYDHSPRNPSLPLIDTTYGPNHRPTMAYNLTLEEAVKHIRSFGFDGIIVNIM